MTIVYLKKNFIGIYSEELKLKKQNISSTKASFLDIDSEIKDNEISTELCDK